MASGGNNNNGNNNPNQPRQPNSEAISNTRDAVSSLGDMRNRVRKLRGLADTGTYDQSGYLSTRQITLYRRLTREIEQIYQQHYQKLQQMENNYQRQVQQQYGTNLQGLQREVQRRQQLYNQATGGNRWGDVASPRVQQYHEKKLREAQQNVADASNMDRELDGLRDAVTRLEQQRQNVTPQTDRIDQLRVRNPGMEHTLRRIGLGVSYGLGLGHGIHSLIDYANPELLRAQERLANGVSQRLPEYNGVTSADADFRSRMQGIGTSNNFGLMETGQTANVLAQGGLVNGNRELKDLYQAQRFGRAYGQDPNQIAGDFATLRKMGVMNEGDMQKFADLIGGAVAKNSMQGREGEMLQATMGLVQQVTQGQISISKQQMGGLVGMQTALGNDIPALKGQAGANLLSGWDAAIKGGGQAFDLIMGKGTNPMYSGIGGSYQLQLLKEQGLTPQTAQTFFTNLDKYFGNGPNSDAMKGFAYEQMGFGTSLEYEKLRQSGFLSQIEKGKLPTADQLKKAGANNLAKQFQNYQNSETSRVDWQNAQKENQKADYQKPFDQAGKALNGMWFQLPEAVRMPLLTAGLLGGGHLATKAVTSIGRRLMTPTVRTFLGGGGGGGMLASLRGLGSRAGTVALDALEAGSRAIPVIGGLAEVGIDRFTNPKNSWGRSISKGIGATIGGIAGTALSGLLDVGTGGVGVVTNAALIGGLSWAGGKAGDWVYNLFNSSDKKSSSKKSSKSTDSASSNSGKDQEYALAQSITKVSNSGNNTIKITVDGKIDGMTPENQQKVSDSIANYFQSATNNYNLAFDQRRG